MKTTLLITLLTITGCVSQKPLETIDEYIPIHVAKEKWDGSKGEFPPGRNRVINYRGHGVDYTIDNGHINHHTHSQYHK